MEDIIWKEIDLNNLRKNCIGFNTKFYASNTGLIKSVKSNGKETIRKTHINNCGYEMITISLYDCKKQKQINANLLVHRIIAKTFIPNPENKKCINHLNENRTDNRVENLEWCTHSENNSYGNHIQKMLKTRKLKEDLKKNNLILLDDGRIKLNLKFY